MESTVIVAIISFIGTLIGTAGGIITSSKITEYRLKELEKKVEKQTAFTVKIPLFEEKLKTLSIRVGKLEGEYDTSLKNFDSFRQ